MAFFRLILALSLAIGLMFLAQSAQAVGQKQVPVCLVADLAACGGEIPGMMAIVLDGASSSDCTTGGGSAVSLCLYEVSAWRGITGNVPIGAFPPATCSAGEVFIDTAEGTDTNCTTTSDNSLCLCVAADTWVELDNN